MKLYISSPKKTNETKSKSNTIQMAHVSGTDDQIVVALKSEEDRGKIRSYITVITLDDHVLMPETLLEGEYKFEGIEFV